MSLQSNGHLLLINARDPRHLIEEFGKETFYIIEHMPIESPDIDMHLVN
jgi:hypothetical protein